MSTELTVGSETFNYPENNQSPGYGEDAHDWAVAVTSTLSTISGPNDITISSDTIANNQSSSVAIVGLQFGTAAVRSFEITYIVYRTSDSSTVTESGKMFGTYDGSSSWAFTVETIGDAGMAFEITAAGQVKYYSTDHTGTNYSGLIKFKASTLDV